MILIKETLIPVISGTFRVTNLLKDAYKETVLCTKERPQLNQQCTVV
jgi:hypothetical protein